MSIIKDNLKYLRKSRGHNQSHISDLLGITTPSYSDYERGKSLPDINKILCLAQYYKVKVDDLLSKDMRNESLNSDYIPENNEKHKTPNSNIIISRISEYIKHKGLSVRKIELSIGASSGALSKAIRNGTDIQSKWIEKIIFTYNDINPLWLLTGNGEMITQYTNQEISDQLVVNEPPASYGTNKTFELNSDNKVDLQKIPLYNIEAFAGLVPLFENPHTIQPQDYISIPNLTKCDGALFVTGDSMYPLLKSGDIIAYKKISDFKNDIYWGEMYLISITMADEEYISVKYIQKSDIGDEYIKLVSENRHHQPKDVHLSKVTAMAMIKASVRINSMG